MAGIVLEAVNKVFPDGTVAVRDLDVETADGEFVVLVGPSGSGKSTALRMIAGIEHPTSGTISIGGRVVNDLSPPDRDIAMVFQSYALYPHMTVFENMAFALKLRKVPKDEVGRRVGEAARLLSITDLLARKPGQLSGGQRQRVAMGRAIVRQPSAFLMDEPLSNLDARLRAHMRNEIAGLHQRLGTSTVYVTHDQVEAVTMADRVAVLRNGVLQQFDTPEELYQRPVNLFVATFIGSPSMNVLPARVVSEGGAAAVWFGEHRLELTPGMAVSLASLKDRDVILGIRPEDLEDQEFAAANSTTAQLEITVRLVESLGAEKIAHFQVDTPPVRNQAALELVAGVEGDLATEAGLATGDDQTSFTARLHRRSSASNGRTMKLAVDSTRLYFFDPHNGKAMLR